MPPSPPPSPRSRRGCFLKVIVGLVLAFAAAITWGWILGLAEEKGKAAHEGVMRPYFAALREGRWQEAYERHTTESYRRTFPFEAWRSLHAGAEWRDPAAIATPGNSARLRWWGGGVYVSYYNAVVTEPPPLLRYHLVETAEGWRINGAWRARFRSFSNRAGNASSDYVWESEGW